MGSIIGIAGLPIPQLNLAIMMRNTGETLDKTSSFIACHDGRQRQRVCHDDGKHLRCIYASNGVQVRSDRAETGDPMWTAMILGAFRELPSGGRSGKSSKRLLGP